MVWPARLVRWPWTALVVVATLAGVWAARPRVSIEPSDALDDAFVLSTPFDVANDGLLSLSDVLFSCDIDEITSPDGKTIFIGTGNPEEGTRRRSPTDSSVLGMLAVNKSTRVAELESGKTTTEFCNLPDVMQRRSAYHGDVTVIVEARLSLVPWPLKHAERFLLVTRKDGKVQWIRRPISERRVQPESKPTFVF